MERVVMDDTVCTKLFSWQAS
uniref:Uncharacterized protein n=1 Tax=Anguilla anguilla TaxID=7936 RepID=A0A0E9S7D9_ANGAN